MNSNPSLNSDHYTALNRLYFGHCWTTGALEGDLTLNGSESGFDIVLLFTARELIEPLQT